MLPPWKICEEIRVARQGQSPHPRAITHHGNAERCWGSGNAYLASPGKACGALFGQRTELRMLCAGAPSAVARAVLVSGCICGHRDGLEQQSCRCVRMRVRMFREGSAARISRIQSRGNAEHSPRAHRTIGTRPCMPHHRDGCQCNENSTSCCRRWDAARPCELEHTVW